MRYGVQMMDAEKNIVMSHANEFARKIKGLRVRLGLTQEQFAAKVGVTFSTVNRWESGRSKPSPLALRRIEELKRISQKAFCEEGRRYE